MPVDRTRPLKFESAATGGTENDDLPTAMDPSEDYANVKGIVFENNEDYRCETDGSGNLGYRDASTGGDAGTHKAFKDVLGQAEAARFTISLLHPSTIQNGTFYGYDSTIPGDTTPIIIPINATFITFSWSNSLATADFTLSFRKNSTLATPFLTVTKTNTQFFSNSGGDETFTAGDAIYIQHTKDNDNAANVALVLYFQVNP